MKTDLKSVLLAAILIVCNAQQLAYMMSYVSVITMIVATYVASFSAGSIRIFKLRYL